MRKLIALAAFVGAAAPGFSQDGTLQSVKLPDIKATILKHFKTSQDFTLKVAAAMPDADYGFRLTAPQMSFSGQMVHLAQGFDSFLSPIYGEKPKPPKPASGTKADVLALVKESFDRASERIGPLTAEQLEKSYKTDEGSLSGLDLLLGLLDHTTHHRASAEMYLRDKGITPPEYQF
jgi:uncharacterized damage-inducible protein DinB